MKDMLDLDYFVCSNFLNNSSLYVPLNLQHNIQKFLLLFALRCQCKRTEKYYISLSCKVVTIRILLRIDNRIELKSVKSDHRIVKFYKHVLICYKTITVSCYRYNHRKYVIFYVGLKRNLNL